MQEPDSFGVGKNKGLDPEDPILINAKKDNDFRIWLIDHIESKLTTSGK